MSFFFVCVASLPRSWKKCSVKNKGTAWPSLARVGRVASLSSFLRLRGFAEAFSGTEEVIEPEKLLKKLL
ncbi:hypothetical protein A3A21_02415 [Candidatus Jorgensenbacteria bacterium RIFCSPLOWO2_01_FULL_45_25b]|uniref:Uncharacterized protein n=1 Tax=Candidatus Jorgensenbacteria bacterium RIFCSPLOWO2_01_FULL_45_25b TaxID=1798471 RepID=A0A1F6BS76_9BACT|nr:MAG: hypothetical protein A3A21_02415 [Candidatus Jorgensenbacteria bacterium RIFCSPLOWO2_01_FULL_45_25b]